MVNTRRGAQARRIDRQAHAAVAQRVGRAAGTGSRVRQRAFNPSLIDASERTGREEGRSHRETMIGARDDPPRRAGLPL